jgi:hypothetical protein
LAYFETVPIDHSGTSPGVARGVIGNVVLTDNDGSALTALPLAL